MNDSTSEYFAQSDSPSLTPHERVAGRLALQARMAVTLTAEEKTDIRRALQHAVYADPAPVRGWSLFSLPVRLPAMAFAVLLLLGVSGGGLYAAESALPGDALYGVKIHVNEAIRAKFQVSPEDRARWAVVRLQRRMDELRGLKARGSADEDIDVALGDDLEMAATSVQAEVDALPAAAAERAAMRTAVNAAIGTDQDSLRRASKINRVLKALKERADGFDAPPQGTIAAPAAVRDDVDVRVDGPLRVNIGGSASVSIDGDASSAARSSTRADASSERPSSKPASSAARSESPPASSVPASEPSEAPLPVVDTPLDAPALDVPDVSVPDVVDGLL